MNRHLIAKLEFRHLQMLVALDEKRSVSKVADILNVSQPAVSKALNTLEADLDLQLFTRTIRGLEPTAQGATLIGHAKAILNDMVQAHDDLHDIQDGRITRLSLGVLPAAATTLVPRLIERLESESVAIKLNVQEGNMELLLPKLRTGEIDFLVGNLPARPLSSEFAHQFLYEDPLLCVARTSHPIFKFKNPNWEKITSYPLLLPPTSTYTRAAIDELLAQRRIAIPRRHVESISTLTNIGVLQLTDSIGFMSREVAKHFCLLDLLRPVSITLPKIALQVGLVWMVNHHRQNITHRLCCIFEEIVHTLVDADSIFTTGGCRQ